MDDPVASVEALKESVCQGASFEALGQTVAHAAALRLARFNTSNEFGDWDTVHHTFTYANAVHQALRRAPSVELLRSVFDAAMSIYLNRFLNVPPARFPEPKGPSSDTEGLLATFLEALNVQQQVEESSELVAMYLQQEEEPEKLMAAMGRALLREDAGFHSFQEVEAGFRQYSGLRGTEAGRHVLVGVTRFLAAHSPTSRTMDQTYRIALRLHRNEKLYE